MRCSLLSRPTGLAPGVELPALSTANCAAALLAGRSDRRMRMRGRPYSRFITLNAGNPRSEGAIRGVLAGSGVSGSFIDVSCSTRNTTGAAVVT